MLNGLWKLLFQAQSNIPPIIDRDIKAIDKLEARAKRAGAGASPLNRILGKLLPGGALGNAFGDAAGGSIGATAGIGAGFLGLQIGRQLIADAQAMDTNREANEKAVADIVRFSDATVTALASLGNQLQIFFGLLKRYTADQFSLGFNIARLVGGAGGGVAARLASGASGKLGLTQFSEIFGSVADFLEDQSARGFASLSGDTSEQDVGRAQERLKDSLSRRRRKSGSKAAARGPATFTPAADELARMGLFVGGSASNTDNLLREQIRKLEDIRAAVREVPGGIADNL